MAWQDYIILGSVAYNVFMSLRHVKLTKTNITKALSANRQQLAQVLEDVASKFEKTP